MLCIIRVGFGEMVICSYDIQEEKWIVDVIEVVDVYVVVMFYFNSMEFSNKLADQFFGLMSRIRIFVVVCIDIDWVILII